MTNLLNFLDDQVSDNTRSSYQTAIIKYLSYIYTHAPAGRYLTPEEFEHCNDLSEKYVSEDHDHADDLRQYARWLREEGYAKKTANNYVNIVIIWLGENDIEFTKRELKRIKKQQPDVGRAREETYTHDIIKQVLAHSDARLAAILMISATSGLRISEVLMLQQNDIDMNTDPVKITIPDRYVKNRRGFTTFISSEAVDCLRAWLQVRSDYIDVSNRRGSGLVRTGHSALKRANDTRIFPYSESTIEKSYGYTLKRAGLDEKDENLLLPRHVYRIHGLRKFFLSNASRYNREIAETLANHTGYLTDEYRRHDDTVLAEEYKKIEPYLAIQIPDECRKLDEKLRGYTEDIGFLRVKNERLTDEVTQLKRLVETLVAHVDNKNAEIDDKNNEIRSWEHAALDEAARLMTGDGDDEDQAAFALDQEILRDAATDNRTPEEMRARVAAAENALKQRYK